MNKNSDSAIVSTDNNYITGESKEISMISILVTIIKSLMPKAK